MNRPKLSVTIITLNEEKNLARCLDSIKEIVGEIIIVDSGSTDKTVEIAEKYGAKVFERKFDNYANQKNYAVEMSTGEWIFSLDADEIVEKDLAEEIENATKNKQYVAYSMPRKNIILGKLIKYTRWQPELDRHVWLWKRLKGKWVGGVHEEVVVDGKVGRLKSAKIHYQYESISEFMVMINRYSEFDAKQRVDSKISFSYLRLVFDPLYNFLVRYFYRLGFIDGWRGFVLSYLMAVYHLNLWIKVWEKERVN